MANDILKTLIAEAIGEGPEGMRLVAETILNRAAIRGLTPEQVVRQPKQYTGLEKPGAAAKRAWDDPEALAAAQAAWELAQQPGDPTGGADHYYAQDTIAAPWWAKGMTPKGEMGGHTFLSSRPLPPGELPEVATALSTVPTPRAPVPVTQSIDLGQYRNNVAPSQLGPETFARLSRPRRTLSDELGMSPIPGGQQQAPMFDAAYDERTGTMRLTRQPIDSQGMAVGSSRPPAPMPVTPSAQIAARRATDRALQAELNRRNPAQLPALPPPMGQPPATRVVQSVPVRTAGPGNLATARNEQAIQRRVAPPVTRLPSTQPMTVEQMYAGIYPTEPGQFRIGSTGDVGPVNPNGAISVSELTGTVNEDGLRVTRPFQPPPYPVTRPPTQFAAAPRVAPVPFQRPTAVGTQLAVQPMPPMPIARPGIGGPFRIAPQPMPASMRPYAGVPQLVSPVFRAAQAVNQSGDTSVGSQADAAAARASGDAGRIRRY